MPGHPTEGLGGEFAPGSSAVPVDVVPRLLARVRASEHLHAADVCAVPCNLRLTTEKNDDFQLLELVQQIDQRLSRSSCLGAECSTTGLLVRVVDPPRDDVPVQSLVAVEARCGVRLAAVV